MPDPVLGNTRDPGKDQTWNLLLGRFQEGLGGDGRQKLTNIFGQSHNRGSLELEEPRENPYLGKDQGRLLRGSEDISELIP